jgi:hypothetical protein
MDEGNLVGALTIKGELVRWEHNKHYRQSLRTASLTPYQGYTP